MEVFIRQAHPGPGVRAYHTFGEKLEDARRYGREENIPWIVAVDDLEGTVHRMYGGLADPTYLIDVDGRVAFYDMWTHAPTLHEAIEALLERGGRGVVRGGIDHVPHMLPALTAGWKGLRRGLPQSFVDLEIASPGAATLTWLGYQARPILAPFTQRARPLPPAIKLALGAGAALLAIGAARAWRHRR